jgi:hypothetical protein
MTREVPDRKKKGILLGLYLMTLIIFFLGVYFSAFSMLNQITFHVLSAEVPGFVFGLLVAYLGIRNYFQVSKFKTQFYKSTASFSWKNFRKNPNKFANILK